ncbi:MAG: hypothetical protein DMD78_01625 [Candidatus Rokuibacteriota bacterium]|nr:MAG: hypothetical protein DMD78_01625 [Candidatus Rokubacteria bacterium]
MRMLDAARGSTRRPTRRALNLFRCSAVRTILSSQEAVARGGRRGRAARRPGEKSRQQAAQKRTAGVLTVRARRNVPPFRITECVQDRLAEGYANASVNRELAALKRAFHLAVEQERLSSAPVIKMLTEAPPWQGFVEPGDFEMIVRHLPDHLRDFARFGYRTGTRKAEIGKLTWADVDRDAGKITFRHEHAKNGQPRVIPLVGELYAIIERRWEARKLGSQICPLVFHRKGQAIRTFRKARATACSAAGHVGLLFHDLRRSAVRNLVGAGVDQVTAMKISGPRRPACSSATGRAGGAGAHGGRRQARRGEQHGRTQPRGEVARGLDQPGSPQASHAV